MRAFQQFGLEIGFAGVFFFEHRVFNGHPDPVADQLQNVFFFQRKVAGFGASQTDNAQNRFIFSGDGNINQRLQALLQKKRGFIFADVRKLFDNQDIPGAGDVRDDAVFTGDLVTAAKGL